MNNFLESIIKRDPAARNKINVILAYPGVKAVFFHFIAHKLWELKIYLIARIISQFSRFLTGIEIHPNPKTPKPQNPVSKYCFQDVINSANLRFKE